MKAQANERGKIESGFKRAGDGWHVVKFQEGITVLQKKDSDGGMVDAVTKKGDKSWKFPMVVEDENDESHEASIDGIAAENDKGEQLVADFLGATSLYATFAKNFPGEVSVFESKVMDKIKTKLPGQYMRLKTRQSPNKNSPDNPYVNIVGFGKMSDKVEELEATLFGKAESKAAGKGKADPKAAAASADEGWD